MNCIIVCMKELKMENRYGKQLTFRFSFRGVNKHGK